MNFATNYGMSPGRFTSLRADPHPASTVEDVSPGGKNIKFIDTAATHFTKPARVSRYERVSDPTKWVL